MTEFHTFLVPKLLIAHHEILHSYLADEFLYSHHLFSLRVTNVEGEIRSWSRSGILQRFKDDCQRFIVLCHRMNLTFTHNATWSAS